MTTEQTFFDEAIKYREIARELHEVLGRTPCLCVETDEYVEYQRQQAIQRLDMTREERLLHAVFGEEFQGEKLASECDRCRVMYLYELAIGDEATDFELMRRLVEGKVVFPPREES